MNAHLVALVLLTVALAFSLLTLLGLYDPRLGLARSRRDALRRNGALALIVYVLMAVALSIGDIDRRAHEPRFGQPAASLPAPARG